MEFPIPMSNAYIADADITFNNFTYLGTINISQEDL